MDDADQPNETASAQPVAKRVKKKPTSKPPESLFGDALSTHKEPPNLYTLPPHQKQIRRLELDLHRQTILRVDQERRLRRDEVRQLQKPAPGQHAKPSVARPHPPPKLGFIDRTIDTVDEASLYALFIKHNSSVSGPRHRKFRASAETAAALTEAHEEMQRTSRRSRDIAETGGLDAIELAALFSELGLVAQLDSAHQEAASRQWLKQLDADGNGTVEWVELKSWWARGKGVFTVKAKTAGEVASERLHATSHWLSRRRRNSISADGSNRPPPPVPVVEGAYDTYAVFGTRPESARLRPTVARKPRSTTAERRGLATAAWHGGSSPRAGLHMRAAPITYHARAPPPAPLAARRAAPQLLDVSTNCGV